MTGFKSSLLRIAMVCFLFVAFVMVGCSRGPNEKELQVLEETKAAALAAEQKNSDCASEKAAAEKQLAEAKQKVDKMNQEKAAVEKRLASM